MNSFDFEDLVSQDLPALVAILSKGVPHASELDPMEWLGVVQRFSERLISGAQGLSDDSWHACSRAFSYVLDAAVASGGIDHHDSVIRRLNLTLALLRRVRPNAAIDILSVNHVVDLLFRELPMSAEEARDLSVDWRSLDIVQIRCLRRIRNLLSPVLSLRELPPGEQVDGRLDAWQAVFPLLP